MAISPTKLCLPTVIRTLTGFFFLSFSFVVIILFQFLWAEVFSLCKITAKHSEMHGYLAIQGLDTVNRSQHNMYAISFMASLDNEYEQ